MAPTELQRLIPVHSVPRSSTTYDAQHAGRHAATQKSPDPKNQSFVQEPAGCRKCLQMLGF